MSYTQTMALESIFHTYYYSSLLQNEKFEKLLKKETIGKDFFARCVGMGGFLPALLNREHIMTLLLNTVVQIPDTYYFTMKQMDIVIPNIQKHLLMQMTKDIKYLSYVFIPIVKNFLLSTFIRFKKSPTNTSLCKENVLELLDFIFELEMWKKIASKIEQQESFFISQKIFFQKATKN